MESLKELISRGESSKLQFKEKFPGQLKIAEEMIAFANSRGGTIVFGVKDKTGEVVGLEYEEVQHISNEVANAANEQIRPTIYVETRKDLSTEESGKKSGKKTDEGGQITSEGGQKSGQITDEGCKKTDGGCMESGQIADEGCMKTDGGCMESGQIADEGCMKTDDGCMKSGKITDEGGKKTKDVILSIITTNPKITYRELSKNLGISIQAIQKHIENLKAKGVIKRVGPDKGGYWEIIQTNE